MAIAGLLLFGCSPKVIVRETAKIEYRDSIVTKIDSVEVPMPVEVIREVVPALDTLEMETSAAAAKAYLDTASKSLRGEMKNKKSMVAPVPVTEKYQYRDSIIFRDIPVEVERIKKVVPKWCWWNLGFSILLLAGAGLALWKKFSI